MSNERNKSNNLAAQLKAEREEKLAKLDLDQCMLLAGENTEVVAKGSLDHCRSMLSLVCQQPLDQHASKGAWVILARPKDGSASEEVESGSFDRDMYW